MSQARFQKDPPDSLALTGQDNGSRVTRAAEAANMAYSRRFDGIVCFGGVDWWYHNRGHYDLQLMRELSAVTPVLYVNSIGMRMPSLKEGSLLLQRVSRKWSSLRRGLVEVRPGFNVQSPISFAAGLGRPLVHRGLSWQVRRATQRLGIHRPLVWIACPPAIHVYQDLKPVGLVYQRTDRFEEYPNVDPKEIRSYDVRLKRDADATLFCSSLLYDEERAGCRNPLFVDHGVDYELFAAAGQNGEEPPELARIPHPRVGYIGNLEPHRVDHRMLVEVAAKLPEMNFVVAGPSALPEGWCSLKNVHIFGQQAYERVCQFMAACDVLIMPWNENEWIRACNPVKLKEYLAVGRPVVTTPFVELKRYPGVVSIASGAAEFARAIEGALSQPPDATKLRARVACETWQAKGEQVLSELGRHGLQPAGRD